MKPKRDEKLYGRPHRSRSAALRAAGYANPKATCWLCGKSLTEGPPHRNGQPLTWHADHVVPGDPRSPLRLAHSTCNEGRGGRSRGLDPPSPNG